MPLSVRLKPELEQLLDATARRERKSRSAIIHEALAGTSDGFALERKQPRKVDRRAWER